MSSDIPILLPESELMLMQIEQFNWLFPCLSNYYIFYRQG